jgi:hypothetical protein
VLILGLMLGLGAPGLGLLAWLKRMHWVCLIGLPPSPALDSTPSFGDNELTNPNPRPNPNAEAEDEAEGEVGGGGKLAGRDVELWDGVGVGDVNEDHDCFLY